MKIELAVILTLVLTAGATIRTVTAMQPSTIKEEEVSTSELELRLDQIDADLKSLADFTMRNGVGTIGYRSPATYKADFDEWIQIDLEGEHSIDQIILVPVIWRGTEGGLVADSFPLEFKVRIGSGNDTEGRIVASFSEDDNVLPRIAPLVINFKSSPASWVRIEASKLIPSVWDRNVFRLKLSEILVFSGKQNIALRKPVSVAEPLDIYGSEITSPLTLVDGFMPYEMDAATGDRSLAFLSVFNKEERFSITMDLAKPIPINQIHLHRVDMNDSIPQSVVFDYGIPEVLTIEGANQKDFSDAVELDQFIKSSVYDVGPVIKRRIKETNCRYIRLTATTPFTNQNGEAVFGLAEIELFSNGMNEAMGSEVATTIGAYVTKRGKASLIDGRNFYGDILTDREWLNQLATRHQLEVERPKITQELSLRYANQRTTLNRLRWIAVLLGVGMIITFLVDRIFRLRQITQIRERLAADLHDELGANLHTIGLLSDLADDSKSADELHQLHRRIRSETERSGNAVRRCSNMLEAQGVYSGLQEDIPRVARRILGDLEHEFSIAGSEHLEQIKPQTGYDIFLFYKECLVNVSRHSDATKFKTELTCDGHTTELSVSDNGKGLPEGNKIPASLKRRAKLLKAKIDISSESNCGTRISLITNI